MTQNPFANLTDTSQMEDQGDVLGGFQIFEGDIYTAEVMMAYLGKSGSSDAQNVTWVFDLYRDGTREGQFRTTIYYTNRNGENWYPDKKDAKKRHPLPGFTTCDDIMLCTTGKPMTLAVVEEKIVNIYDFDARAELPKSVMVMTQAIGKKVDLGITKCIEDKNKKNDNTGKYEPTGETREQNEVDKVFHAETKQTLTEARNGGKANFYDKWAEKHAGKVKNNSKGAQGTAGAPSMPSGGAGGGAATPDLFSKST